MATNHPPESRTPATGKHDPKTCPPRHDGAGNSWPCDHWAHDEKLFKEALEYEREQLARDK